MNEIVSGALASKAGGMSFLELFLQAHIVVQAVMVGLLLASVLCWAIVIEKSFAFRRARREADDFEGLFWSGQSLEASFLRWHGKFFQAAPSRRDGAEGLNRGERGERQGQNRKR